MKIKMYLLVLLSVALFSCSNVQQQKPVSTNLAPGKKPADNALLMATLYNYYAAEYQALSYQAYNVAKERVTQLYKEFPKKKNMAVVLDIDETVLNNSPYQALTIEKSSHFPSYWDTWVSQAAARPVPGAISFLRYADSLGFHIFYVTNRSEKLKAATLKNLQKFGFPQADSLHLYLKTTTGNKEPRRQMISKKYDIVLLAGDNIGDFYKDSGKYPQRNQKVAALRSRFGKKYIVLPNAMYGSWPAGLGLYSKHPPIDSLLKVMTKGDF
ncbi:MAG: 5'-nucleotidase [bacterium]|nr:MAG: 5'-nucleotidase [bacterium]